MEVKNRSGRKKRVNWKCTVCEYIYDAEESRTAFEDLSNDLVCCVCGVGKEAFEKED